MNGKTWGTQFYFRDKSSQVLFKLLCSFILANMFLSVSFMHRATKIVLKGGNASQLIEMENEAKRMELPCYLVVDAGRTQVT